MAEIIVEADRDLYTDDEWRELVLDSELVRCRNCRHWDAERWLNGRDRRKFCGVWKDATMSSGYCYRGERRTA